MNIIFAAHRAGVAKFCTYLIECRKYVLLCGGFGHGAANGIECEQNIQRPRPQPKVFRAKIRTRCFLYILVHTSRINALARAIGLIILKEFLSGNVPAFLHDPRQPFILQRDVVLHSLLAFERKVHLTTFNFYVFVF